MSETTLLRNTAIVRNATVAPPQHGPVKTGALPLVQVRMAPGGPQIQEGQQKPVTILPPRDDKSAVATGGLPMVNVKMTQNGPQVDDGRDQPVIVRDAKHPGVATGGLPMIQVKMDGGKPQVQTIPNVKGGPPQIPAAPPALSAPRVPRAVGVHVARVPAPSRPVAALPVAPVVTLPEVPELSTEQLMLCRHALDKYLGEIRNASEGADAPGAEIVQLAEETIDVIDQAMVSIAVRAEAAAIAAATVATAVPVPTTQAFAASASIGAAPSVAYVAGRGVGQPTPSGARSYGAGRSYVAPGARAQRNSGMAPRGVARAPSSLPPVIVKMEGRQPVVQSAPPEVVAAEVLPTQPVIAPEISTAAAPATPATDAQG